MNVTYNEKTYELKYSFRALMIYENITGKSFNPKTVSDIIFFFYSVLCSTAKHDVIDFDNFIEMLDEHPELITEFSGWLTSVYTQQEKLTPDYVQEEAELKIKKSKKSDSKN